MTFQGGRKKIMTTSKKHIDSTALSAETLKGRQSVRATFRLPDEIIALLGLAASQLGLKQKSIFDQLFEDDQALEKAAARARDCKALKNGRRSKTFVLSKKSLLSLNIISQRENVPRDLIVEISIQRLLPIINAEQEKHQKREKVYDETIKHLRQGQIILHRAAGRLGEKDQLYEVFQGIVNQYEERFREMNGIIEKGREMGNITILSNESL